MCRIILNSLMTILAVLVLGLLILVSGCSDAQQVRSVWGQGDPPAEWQDMFGNENLARLNFVQTNTLNAQGQAMAGMAERLLALEAIDPNDYRGPKGDAGPQGERGEPSAIDPKDLPYIYTDPLPKPEHDPNSAVIFTMDTSTDTVCSKHGRLRWGGRVSFFAGNRSYCCDCVTDVIYLYLDKHIKGMVVSYGN